MEDSNERKLTKSTLLPTHHYETKASNSERKNKVHNQK